MMSDWSKERKGLKYDCNVFCFSLLHCCETWQELRLVGIKRTKFIYPGIVILKFIIAIMNVPGGLSRRWPEAVGHNHGAKMGS